MKERSPSWKSIALFELYYIWHMKTYHVLTRYHLLLAMARIALLCASALLQNVSACINWSTDWVHFKWLVWNCRKPWPSDEATIKLSLVYNHFGGLSCRWALQFSTFPDEWYSKAYFHSHIINTFLPTPASNIPNHFRQCAHAILDRHERRRWGEKLRQLSDVAAECLVELY